MPSLSFGLRPYLSLLPLVSLACVHARGSGSGIDSSSSGGGSGNVTQSQTGARDVISLVPVCSAFPFRSHSPVVRLSVGSIIAHTAIHTYVRSVCACVCVCVYIDENSFNAPHVLGRLPLLPSASSSSSSGFCHLFCAHFYAGCLLLCFFVYISHGCCVSLFILASFLPCHSQSKSHASFSDSIFHVLSDGRIHTHTHVDSLSQTPIHAYALSCFGFAIQSTKIKCVCQMMMYRTRA